MEKKPLLLVGYFGFGNLGDEEALRIFTERLCARGIPYRVLSRSGERKGGRAVTRRDLLSLKKAICGSSAMVAVGGNLLQSESSFRSLLCYAVLFSYAEKRGIPLFLYGGGIGGFRDGRSERIVRHLLPRFSYLGLRTAEDLLAVKAWIPGGSRCRATPDLCFSLPEKDAKKENLLLLIPRKRSVGDPWLGELMRSAPAMGWRIVIAAFHPKEDGAVLSRLAARYGAGFFAPRSYEEFARVCAVARISVSERFHGGVFSLLCHTPCRLLTASDKCRRLCDTVEALAPEEGLLCPFRNYREVTERMRDMYASDKAKKAGTGCSRAAEGVANEGLPSADKKETGDGVSGFSRVISLLRTAEEESFNECLRLWEEG
ncbi:MAG TPA: hypothetical protein DDY70_00630 [Clostridiales bacterium]|nr:hypothetical protein [Clostridiales bacterium]